MNLFDIAVLILLLLAVFRGKSTGFVRQVVSLIGLALGVWLSWAVGPSVGGIFVEDEKVAVLVGFIVVFLAVVIVLAVIGYLVKGVFKIAGLGTLDEGLGIFLSVVKTWAVVSLLCYWVSELPQTQQMVAEDIRPGSLLYEPLISSAETIFPYIDFAKEYVSEADLSIEGVESLVKEKQIVEE